MNDPLVRSDLSARGAAISSRWLRRVGVGVLATVVLGLLGITGLSMREPAVAQTEPQLREFTLVASEFDWEIQPGKVVRAWGYNGTMPGPEIRVKEGDTVRITLKNELPVGTTIHWHGVMVPPEMDGPAGLNQAEVEPGDSFVYEFTATPAGTRMYHSHTDVVNQIALGLYGAFIVEPREQSVEYDKEYVYTLAEWDDELTPAVAMGTEPRGPRDSQLRGGELGTDIFLMNGKAHEGIPPIIVDEGDRVLIRLINMGSLIHPIHLHGHLFKIVSTDGNPVPEAAQLTKDTVAIAPGERYDIELVADNPGVWMVHCHIESHAANGMMTLLEYEGALPTGPLKEYWTTSDAPPAMDHSSHGSTEDQPAASPVIAEMPEPTAESTGAAGASSDAVVVELLDDRMSPKLLEIKGGTTVTFVNNGGNWHNVQAKDGSFSSPQLQPGETFSVTFDTPGEYSYLCRSHARHGMFGKIVVTA